MRILLGRDVQPAVLSPGSNRIVAFTKLVQTFVGIDVTLLLLSN